MFTHKKFISNFIAKFCSFFSCLFLQIILLATHCDILSFWTVKCSTKSPKSINVFFFDYFIIRILSWHNFVFHLFVVQFLLFFFFAIHNERVRNFYIKIIDFKKRASEIEREREKRTYKSICIRFTISICIYYLVENDWNNAIITRCFA